MKKTHYAIVVGIVVDKCFEDAKVFVYINSSNFVHLAELKFAHLMLGEIVGAERVIHIVFDSLVELAFETKKQKII